MGESIISIVLRILVNTLMLHGVLTTNLYVTSLCENGTLSLYTTIFFYFIEHLWYHLWIWWSSCHEYHIMWVWERKRQGSCYTFLSLFLIYKIVVVLCSMGWAHNNSLFFQKVDKFAFPSWDHDSKMIYINENHNITLRLVFTECSFKCNGSRNFLSYMCALCIIMNKCVRII